MKIYKSKIGFELVIPISLALGVVIVMGLIQGPAWPAVMIASTLAILIAYLFLTTRYIIDDTRLLILCGFLFNQEIDIHSMQRIRPSRNPWSSPATSLDRLEIQYSKSGFILLSPLDKAGFIADLKKINPAIDSI